EWAAAIERGPPTFILLHHPPFPYLGFPPIVFGLDEAGTALLEDLAHRLGAWAIFCGHTHRCAASELAGTPVLEVPSVKEWPFGYGIVEVAGSGWSFNLRPITNSAAVAEFSPRASLLFRRYARGPEEARAFVGLRPPG
ncbi:MAG: metallophosphoesterase family protein, partial [Actinomycetota bacterium]